MVTRAVGRFGCSVVTACLVAAASVGVVSAASGDESLSAVKVLLDMKKAYRSCQSYLDHGEVRVSGTVEGGSFGSRLPFATAFVRGGAFRFEFTDQGLGERASRLILWASGDEVRAWWEVQGGERRVTSLAEALGAASGVSAGASLRVPGLLLPDRLGEGFFLGAPERLEDEPVDGVTCYRIRGLGRQTPFSLVTGSTSAIVEDERVTVWIDRGTSLLRRIEERRVLSTYSTVTVTSYEPAVDRQLTAEQLAFDPPAAPAP